MISIIITAFHEEKSIGNVIENIIRNAPEAEYEIILACPDEETKIAAEFALDTLKFDFQKFIYIKDPQKGKPAALNLAFEKANGEILILTDGDIVKLGEKALDLLTKKLSSDTRISGVTGRPISADSKENLFGYWGHLLADAADHRRTNTLKSPEMGNQFFVMSGYLMAIRKPKFKIPEKVLSDDAYISYKIAEENRYIIYEPKATVSVKYPTNFKDWYNQKCRSLGGYIQLHKMGVINHSNKSRSFWGEVSYAWFPLKYASNFKEFAWSLLLYPVRLFLWLKVFIERKLFEKSFEKTWVRIESTK